MDIPWPSGGLSETFAYDDQPPRTTSDAKNVRNYDPLTGRNRGAKRVGRSRQFASRIDSLYPIRDVLGIPYTQKTVDYALDPSSVWTAGAKKCIRLETDLEGNVYALNGESGIDKYSASGTKIYTYQCPVDTGAFVGALDVDEGKNVYAGVSGERGEPIGAATSPEPGNGFILGNMDDARLWKLRHGFRNNDDENEPELEIAWELSTDPNANGPTLRGLIGFVRARGGRLYTLQHDVNRHATWLVVYDAIHSGVPVVAYERGDIPYPGSSIDVAPDGKMAITAEYNPNRGLDPEHPGTTMSLVGWEALKNIDDDVESSDEKHRIWSYYIVDPKYLISTGGITPEDGDQILIWFDAGPGGRHLEFVNDGTLTAPRYKENGLNGKPCLVLDGDSLLEAKASPSNKADFRTNQRGIFPTYTDPDNASRSAQYISFTLCRPEAQATEFPLWSHEVAFTSGTDQSALIVNRNASDSLSNAESGSLSWHHLSDGTSAEGTATQNHGAWLDGSGPNSAFGNTANALLVTCGACNGVDTGDEPNKFRSFMRVWGQPISRFEQDPDSLNATSKQYLGGSGHSDFSAFDKFKGEIYTHIVLDRRDLDTTGVDSVASHPVAPDSTDGTMVGQVRITNEGSGGNPSTDSGPLSFSGGTPDVPASGSWSSVNGKITSLTLANTGSGYDSAPTVTAADGPSTVSTPSGNEIRAGMEHVAGYEAAPGDDKKSTIVEKIEGEIAWRYGLSHYLSGPGSYTVDRVNTSGTAGTYAGWRSPHPHFWALGLPTFLDEMGVPESDKTQGLSRFFHKSEILILMDGSGKLLDVKSHGWNGVGLGCRFGPDGTSLYTVGSTESLDAPAFFLPLSVATVRRWFVQDSGNMLEAWKQETSLRLGGPWCGIKVDKNGNVYVPCNAPLDTTNAFSLAVFGFASGATIHEFSLDSGTANQGTYAVALPRVLEKADVVPGNPDYGSDLSDDVAEHVFIGGRAETYAGTALMQAVRRYDLVTSTPNGNKPRLRADIAVHNGSFTRFDGATLVTPSGTAALSAAGLAADYVHSVAAFEKGYFTDGSKDVVYDPSDDSVATWEAERGEIPARCRIVELWRGRVIRCGDVETPGAVHGSALGDPLDWDTSPPVPTPTQAFDFATTEVGDVPDRVTGFVSYNDDVALVGGDRTIWRLRGDPMAGGQLDLISDITGMAFGRAWCKDPEGRIWFFGSRGGMYVMNGPDAIPERVTRFKIEKRLRSIDLSTYYIRMVYDYESDGIWIMVIPFAAPTEVVTTYFFEMKQGAFWPDEISSAGRTVTALTVVDGDEPDDRRVLFGHGDGFVRYPDPEKASDDGAAIDAYCLIGPFTSPVSGQEIRTTELGCVLASPQNGVEWEMYASDTPDDKGSVQRSGKFAPGNNATVGARTLGSYVWVELSQRLNTSRFAVERLYIGYEPAGRQRVRSG